MIPRNRLRIASLATAFVLVAGATAFASDPLGLMPEAASDDANEIDDLIYLVTYITGITFVGVQGLLLWFLIRYRAREGVRAKHVHGNHTVELIWTVVPALILVFLALYQADIWLRIKAPEPEGKAEPVRFQIFAKQFEWNFRYPGPDGEYGTQDDIACVNQCIVPLGRPAVAEMRSMDVLHSFFLPNFRVKQDAVPGMGIPIWFESNKLSAERLPIQHPKKGEIQLDYWDIVCAELCGNQHTSMAAKLYVVTEDEYQDWMRNPKSPMRKTVLAFPCDPTDKRSIWFRWPDQQDRSIQGPPRWKKGFPFYEDDLGVDNVTDEDEDF